MIDNSLYVTKYIKKKNKLRKIITYREDYPELRILHKRIIEFIGENFLPSKFSKAYIKNRSIYHNAYAHMYNDIFISLDVKDFFSSIDHKILVNSLYYELNKRDENTITKLECGKIISKCSVSTKGLPLGLITSPLLSNVYLKEFDNILYGKLKKLNIFNVIFTRYADDIVISFKNAENIDINYSQIITIVEKLLNRYKLKLNKSKTRIINFDRSNHVKITGINIVKDNNNYRKLSVGRKVINDLFHLAIKNYEQNVKDKYEIMKVKGLESFILSIEKNGYDGYFSKNMKKRLDYHGFATLHDLISNLDFDDTKLPGHRFKSLHDLVSNIEYDDII